MDTIIVVEDDAAAGDLPPPWVKHPEIPWGSIGWRMGYGESWIVQWHAWLAEQPRTPAFRRAYLQRHRPAPRTWLSTVDSVLEPDRSEDDEPFDPATDRARAAQLRAEGLIGDDVAYAAWVATHDGPPPAPWSQVWEGRTVGDCAEYDARELTFWARWCADRRAEHQLEAWLRHAPEPPPGWEAMREAAATGTIPSMPASADCWHWLTLAIAADGWPPPPWTQGLPPSSLHGDDDDDEPSRADAWARWILEALDDRATWRAYLARHEPMPESWVETIDREVWLPQ